MINSTLMVERPVERDSEPRRLGTELRTNERTNPPRRKNTRTRNLFLVDVGLFALFALVVNVPLTGVAIHEWLGIAIAVAMVVHLVQHGDWVASMGRKLLSRTSFQNRVNYLLMFGLFFGFASITISGLLISEAALPFLGITVTATSFWFWVHVSSVGWVIALTAIHIAMNWRWIVNATQRVVLKPLSRLGGSA